MEKSSKERFFDWLYNNVLTLVVLIAGIAGTFYMTVYRVGELETRVSRVESGIDALEARVGNVEREMGDFKSNVNAEFRILNFKIDLLLQSNNIKIPASFEFDDNGNIRNGYEKQL